MRWLTGLLDEVVTQVGVRFPADLLLFRKSLHTLEGVLEGIDAGESRADGVLMAEFVRHFARDWPRRWISMPNASDFETHLSNADLALTWCGIPAAIGRYWLAQNADLWNTWQNPQESPVA